MNRQTYSWSAALMLTAIAATEVIYPMKTHEHFIPTVPDYTPYMVAAICLCLAIFAVIASRHKTSREFETLNDENERTPSSSKSNSPKLPSSSPSSSTGMITEHFSRIINGLKLLTPGGKVAHLSKNGSPTSSINGDT